MFVEHLLESVDPLWCRAWRITIEVQLQRHSLEAYRQKACALHCRIKELIKEESHRSSSNNRWWRHHLAFPVRHLHTLLAIDWLPEKHYLKKKQGTLENDKLWLSSQSLPIKPTEKEKQINNVAKTNTKIHHFRPMMSQDSS